ncbi:MAG: hypothetical protein IJR17_03000 [Clostridia bacterium]|nr:hypothetical protein [Clostridia bacterium]
MFDWLVSHTVFHLVLLVAYVALRSHTIRCLKAAQPDHPVQRRFSLHRDKGMAAFLGGAWPAFILINRLSYLWMARVLPQGSTQAISIQIGSVFILYPLLYVIWELWNMCRFGKAYADYCTSYSLRQMNEEAAYKPDNPVQFRRKMISLQRFLLWLGIILIVISFAAGAKEYASFTQREGMTSIQAVRR